MARLYAWAGDKDSALAELGQLFAIGAASATESTAAPNVHLLKREPNFFPSQGKPRFEEFLNDPQINSPLFRGFCSAKPRFE